MKIGILGTGYVGTVAGACFADIGHHVICADVDRAKIAMLNGMQMPIYEPGLAELVGKTVAAGRLEFSDQLADAAKGRQAVFLAVGTPTNPHDGSADMRFVFAAAETIIPIMEPGSVLVTKSTVPVGTARKLTDMVARLGRAGVIKVVSNPEFLREGVAIKDFAEPDRIIVGLPKDDAGALDAIAKAIITEIYEPLLTRDVSLFFTGATTAEMIKYASNAFLATKISFINEIADLCEKVDADVEDVSQGIGLDHRIGRAFLKAGPGYGGSCFPKDTLALAHTAREHKTDLSIIETVIHSNHRRKKSLAARVIEAYGSDVSGKRVALLGLTFKPGTDDMRDSPAIDLVKGLHAANANVIAYDPEGMKRALQVLEPISYAQNTIDCIKDADIVVLVTEWGEFRTLDLRNIAAMMQGNTFVDLRNVFSIAKAREAGLHYVSIGRVSHPAQALLKPAIQQAETYAK